MCTRIILVILIFCAGWQVNAQQVADTLSVKFKNTPLETVLDSISLKTGYFFSYNAAIAEEGLYTLERKSIEIGDLLNELLSGTGLEFIIVEDQVVLKKIEKRGLFSAKREASKQTAIISGWVKVEGSEEVLEGVNVFISGTTIGTVSGPDGTYLLENVPAGSHQLVFSYVGYSTVSFAIRLQPGSVYVQNATMISQANELPPIEISSLPYVDAKFWHKHFKDFEREFIGSSQHSFSTSITNKEVLNFTYDRKLDVLKAYAEEPLEVVNNSLGYMIICHLEYFEKQKDVTSFHIKAGFQPMDYSSRREKRKWKKNRKFAYRGSSVHFFQSLIKDNYESEGFQLYKINDNKKVKVKREDILRKSQNGVNWILDYPGTLYVEYVREKESSEYLAYLMGLKGRMGQELGVLEVNGATAGYQKSQLELKEGEVVLLNDGQLLKPKDIMKLGYWSWERVADLMPMDYGIKINR